MKSLVKNFFKKDTKKQEESLIEEPQINILDSLKEDLDKLSELEKMQIIMYLDISLKEYEIARLENKLMYADDIERVKIRRKLNNLLDRDNLEDYEH
ncbi:MAG: hypothetical protein KBE03_03730 [Leptotrichiaceae bacterium]|mgnify:FL=1|nr:hypothetical protein [Leptotrichiaceae bacterium]